MDYDGPTTPGQPVGTPNPNNTGSHLVTWTASTDDTGVAAYELERSANGGAFVLIASPAANSFQESGLPGGSYLYRVRARDTAGNLSAYSPTSAPVIVDQTAPGAPADLAQFEADGTTPLPLGAAAASGTVVLKASIADLGTIQTPVKLEIEVKAVSAPFDGTGLVGGAFQAGGLASVPVGPLGNGSYHWQARAVDQAGNAGPFASFGGNAETEADFIVGPQAPAAPGGFAGTALSPTSIQWSWTDVAGETSYEIHDAAHGVVGTVGADTTLFVESGLSENAVYTRHVHASNATGSSPASASAAVYTRVHDPLAGDFTVITVSSSRIDLSVTAPPNGSAAQTGCEIDRSADGVGGWVTIKPFSSVYAASDTGLSPDTTYYYRFRYRNGDAVATLYSPTKSQTTSPVPPPAPAGFAGTALSPSSIQWTWGNVAGETGFEVHDDAHAVVGTVGADVLTFTETGLGENVLYSRHVHAVNGAGAGAASNTAARYTKVHDPLAGDFTLTVVSESRIDIGVIAPPNGTAGLSGCEIDRSPDGAAWTPIKPFSAVYTHSDTGLSASTTYHYRFRYRNGDAVVTLYAPTKTAATNAPPAPPAPAGLAGTALSPTSIQWTWGNVAGETSFEVHDDAHAVIGTVGADVLSFTESGLSENTLYSRHVHAVNSGGSSPASNTASRYTKVHDPALADFSLTVISASQIDVAVVPPPNSASAQTGCRIDRSADGSTWAPIKPFSAVYGFSDTSLAAGTTYHYRILYRNGDAVETLASLSRTATTSAAPQPPAAPVITTPAKKTNDTTPVIGGTSEPNVTIKVFFGAVQDGTTTANGSGVWTYHNLAAPKLDATYSVTAKASNANGDSPASNAVSITVDTVVTPPSNVVATAMNQKVHLTWTASPDADVIGYEVWRSEAGAPYIKIHTGLVAGTSYCDSSLTNGVQYCYQVRAADNTLQEAHP
jgi:titin